MARKTARKPARTTAKPKSIKARPKSPAKPKPRKPAAKKAVAPKKKVAKKPTRAAKPQPKAVKKGKSKASKPSKAPAPKSTRREVAIEEASLRTSRSGHEVPPQVTHPKLTAAETRELKKTLEEERDRLMGELNRLSRNKLDEMGPSDQPNRFGNHLADVASDSQILETMLLQSGLEAGRLREIVLALERIDHHKYGTCERCGANIGVDRLMAKPHAKFCIVCREYLERLGDPGML